MRFYNRGYLTFKIGYMDLSIFINGKKELNGFPLLGGKRENNISPIERNRNAMVHNEYYLCYSTPLFGIVYFNFGKMEAKEVRCEFEGNSVFLSFQRNGKSFCKKKHISGSMEAKQNNIFFNSGHLSCQMSKSDCFRGILSEKFIMELSKLSPEAMKPIVEAFRSGQNSLYDPTHLDTTLDMELIIQEIEHLHLLGEEKDLFIEAKVRELLYKQIIQRAKNQNTKDFKLDKYRSQMQMACSFIEGNVKKLPPLNEIASYVGVCDTILKVAFKHFYGKTVNEYYNEYRLNKARKLLKDPAHNIADVAYLTGYRHTSYFSTAFKQKYEIMPKDFRKNMLDNLVVESV